MRIVLAGPPKTGNVWVEKILATAYGLRSLDNPPSLRDGVEGLRRCIAGGGFPDGTIFHQHFRFSEEFASLLDELGCRIVTVLRDPYDTFVSLYFYVQRFSDTYPPNSPALAVLGKPIDHPDTLAFLAKRFGHHLKMAREWLESGRSVVVRYEDLQTDPLAAATQLTDQIHPIPAPRVARAVKEADARKMKKQNRTLNRHIRAGTTGDWRNHLTEAHLAIFRDRHAALVAALGYAVR